MSTITGTGGDDFRNDSIIGTAGDYYDLQGGDDTLFAGGGNDTVFGGSGDDRIDGGTGNDALYGGSGLDSLVGGAGNDTLFGGTDAGGFDTLIGGDGFDYVSYSGLGSGVTVNLGTGIASGGGGDDLISQVEGVIGGNAADNITGNDGNNDLRGLGGNDTINGGLGDDTIEGGLGNDNMVGGGGNDTLSFDNAAAGVTVNLGNGTASGSQTGSDTFSEFEGVLGSAFGDNITGDSGANTIDGGVGNDTIDGGAGNDLLIGGPEAGQPTSVNPVPLDFNWNLAGGDAAPISQGYTQDTGGIEVTVNYTGGFAGSTITVETGAATPGEVANGTIYNNAGAGETFNPNSSAELYRPGGQSGTATPLTTLQLDFTAVEGSGYLDEVRNVAFRISDIDDDGFRDIVTVRAYDAEGNEVPVSLTETSGSLTTNGNIVNAINGTGNLEPSDAGGSVLVTIAGPVARVVIEYGNLENNQQAINVSDVQFQAVPAIDNDNIVGGTGADTILGGSGNDTIDGGADADSIFGGTGNDQILGGAGADSIFGGDGNDRVNAGSENDVVDGGLGADSIQGDAGDDSLVGGDGADTLEGGIGNDQLFGGAGSDSLDGGAGDDTLTGGAGNDFLRGDSGMDFADYSGSAAGVNVDLAAGTGLGGDAEGDSLSGIDGLFGSDQADTLRGFGGSSTVPGDAYTNVFYGNGGNDILEGFGSNDSLFGGTGDDSIDGGADNDFIQGDSGADSLLGGSGDDTIDGGTENDRIFGNEGNDSLLGGAGDDSIDGGANDDLIFGGAGNDNLLGGAGNDNIDGGANDDVIAGGAGSDSILGSLGDDSIDGGAENDRLFGNEGNDTLLGDAGDDSIDGGDNADLLFGGIGNDLIFGGTGNDTFQGGAGVDSLYGGVGNDLFLYAATDFDGTLTNEIVDGGGTLPSPADDFDVLDLREFGKARVDIVFTNNDRGSESGTVTIFAADGITQIGTISFTEIEQVIPCFTPGTLIQTARGEVPVETLQAGDLVMTRDNGLQPLRWVGQRRLSMAQLMAEPDLQPVQIGRGALSGQGPDRDMLVSPQHRILVEGARAEMLFGEAEVLVPAKHLVGKAHVTRVLPEAGVTYIHILFDRHEIVQSDGIWTESFQPAERMLSAMEAEVRAEVLALFPQLEQSDQVFEGARLSLKAHEARVLFAAE
ncbi:Hint domain-containing protein [Tabrizicola aquatica]|uniref:Hint domain-containing protein n=1 Tax=Tabrizicola aquatica TaxID=909926 RepID=UPI0011AFA869|nr:Hint domain-containing protein [Tabrizicola aquatica]